MNFRNFFALSLVILALAFKAEAQFVFSPFPEYLEASDDHISMRNNDFYVPGKMPAEAYKKHDLPRFLGNSKYKIINISGTTQSQTETSISINPSNPSVIIGSSNDYRYNSADAGYMMGAYYSADAGKSWNTSTTPGNIAAGIIKAPANGSMTNFDPGIAFDTKGYAYYSYGFTQVLTVEDEGDNGVFVCRTSDGGKTWEGPFTVVKETNSPNTQPFNDRYSIACDINPGSPYKDNIYITWQRFIVNPAVVFSKSTDHGKTWSTPVVLPGSLNQDTQSPYPAIGPNGEIYVVWQLKSSLSTTDAVFQKSTDGGKTWLPNPVTPQVVGNIGLLNSNSYRNVLYTKQSMRVSAYPSMAVDISSGSRKGTIYIVQAGKNDYNQTAILLTKSADNGKTWTKSLKIDDNNINTDVFFPSITVDPVSGMIGVLYYSSQNDSNNIGVDAYLALSSDGSNFNRIRLTPETWYLSSAMSVDMQGTGNYYWGDYTSITSYNGKFYPCFWMPSSPNGYFWTNNSYTVLISNDPNPPSNLAAKNDYSNPTSVKLTWTDPTTDLLGNPLTDFKIIVLRNDTEISSVDKGTLQYTDNGAENGKKYIYSLKTRVSPTKESDTVSIPVSAGGGLIPGQPTDISAVPQDNAIKLSWKNPDKHTDGSYLNDLSKIVIYANESKVAELIPPAIQSGTYSTTLLSLPSKAFYEIKIASVANRNGIETAGSFTDSIVSYCGPSIINFSDNFDSNQDSLIYYSKGTKGQWLRTKQVSFSSPNCITDSRDGKYTGSDSNKLIFQPVVITPGKTVIGFRQIALIDNKGDFGLLRVSKDFGKTWDNIGAFNQDSSAGFTGDVTTSKWQKVTRNLSNYLGDTLYISFVLATNPVINKDGWYIDNVEIDDRTAVFDEITELFEHSSISVNPNPVKDIIHISTFIPVQGYCDVVITDLLGNQVKIADNTYKQAGASNYDYSVSNLLPGVYTLRLTISGITKITKFIKL